jgi:hypothetical protein
MENIKVNKAELISTLQKNRAQHRKIFEEACAGYEKEVIRELQAQLKRAKEGIRRSIYISIAAPTDQTKEYDRAIAMLNMSVDNEVMLSERDFQCYVLDDWSWKQDFLKSSSLYSQTAARALAAADEAV